MLLFGMNLMQYPSQSLQPCNIRVIIPLIYIFWCSFLSLLRHLYMPHICTCIFVYNWWIFEPWSLKVISTIPLKHSRRMRAAKFQLCGCTYEKLLDKPIYLIFVGYVKIQKDQIKLLRIMLTKQWKEARKGLNVWTSGMQILSNEKKLLERSTEQVMIF
jgi:hypothetical protein